MLAHELEEIGADHHTDREGREAGPHDSEPAAVRAAS